VKFPPEEISMIKQLLVFSVTLAALCGARIGYTASDEHFYKGKTIRLIVAFSPGGGYDAYSRVIGRHLGKFIPGNPAIVVENMTGAGGIIHANFMYQAKPDGLIIGNNAGGLILQQIMGAKGIEFDGKRFEFLGAPGSDHHVCTLSKASGITSMEKWFASKEPVKFGGVGPGGGASDNARVLQAALGLPIRVIDGYKGTADIRLAAESGELAGACFAWESFKTTWRKGLESGDFSIILQAMPKKHPDLANVPLANDYVKTDVGRRLLKHGIYDTAVITRPYFVAPGTPQGRVQILRKAFADTLNNPEFLAEAKKASLDIQHVSGEETEAVVQGLFKIEPAFIAKMKQILVP
jgi:tripartite-type tricarboxylate transporter receptor subunit TctC